MLEKDLEIKDTDEQRRKLVDYFNQWWEEKFGEKGYFKYTMRFDEVHLISKKMGFIKWLVDNDKISHFEVDRKMIDSLWRYHGKETTIDRVWNNLDKVLIALLSVSDTPIEDLISYLK